MFGLDIQLEQSENENFDLLENENPVYKKRAKICTKPYAQGRRFYEAQKKRRLCRDRFSICMRYVIRYWPNREKNVHV